MSKEKRMVMVFSNKGQPIKWNPTPNRNDKCHCGSEKKYKVCHLILDEQRLMGKIK